MKATKAATSKGGWKIPLFGKASGLTAIRSRDVNQNIIIPLNALGKIKIVRTARDFDEVVYSKDNLILALGQTTTTDSSSTLPFQIYQGSTWLKAKVTTGPIITTGAKFTPTNPDTDVTLTSGAQNYIYFEFADATSGSFIATATPASDVNRIPIGIVDTTNTTDSLQVITQLWPFFIYNPCL